MDEKLPFETWSYEEQTKRKHLVLEDYFDKWVKILGKFHNLNYFDCFGGIGAYTKDSKIYYGSPILAAQIAQKNNVDLKRNVTLVIIDNDSKNIENIQKILKYLNLDVKLILVTGDFDKTINEILDKIGTLAPTFFFIDPFGFKIKMETLKRIMNIPRSEIFLNFMFNAISRFLSYEKVDRTKTELFGGDEWKQIENLNGTEREIKIRELYRSKLKEFSKFVYPFKFFFPDKNRTYYYLFHLTNHYKGCAIMKSCFAKYHSGRTEYRGKMQNQKTLFEVDETQKVNNIEQILLIKYHNTEKKYIEIIKDLIDETEFLESDFLKAIRALENNGKIKIERHPNTTPTGKERKSIELQDIIQFVIK